MEPIEEFLLSKWKKRSLDPDLLGWHAFSVRQNATTIVSTLYEPERDPEPLRRSLIPFGKVTFKVRFVRRFRQLRTGKQTILTPLQPGSAVRSVDDDCKRSDLGTVGAFLRLSPCRTSDEIWLLSCNHILVRKPECLKHNFSVRTLDEAIISSCVKYTTMPDGSFLDAALAKLNDPTGIKPIYDPRLGLTSLFPTPIVPPGTRVKKQGNSTGVTCGQVLDQYDHAAVLTAQGDEVEDEGDIMVASILGECKFLDDSDSGSLMVAKGQPAGIVHSMSDTPASVGLDPSLTSPFGFVTPLTLAIDLLSAAVDPTGTRKLAMLPLQFPVIPCP